MLYVNYFPKYVTSSLFDLFPLFNDIKETLEIDHYVHEVHILPVYNSTLRNMEINGDITFVESSLPPRPTSITAISTFSS